MASAGNIRAGGAFVEIFATDSKFQAAMTRVQNRLRQTGKNLQQFGTGLALGAGAVGAPMALAVRQFASLDDAVRAAAAAAGKGEGDLAGMRTAAEQLAIKFGMAAVDVAKLGVEIARAFGDKLTTEQINSVTEAVVAMSKVAGGDGAEAASIMTSTLGQFGLSAEHAGRVADVLTHASNSTNTSLLQLGEAFSYAGVNAAEMGLSLEETAAILGTLGNVGIQGSMAGTTLRRLSTVTAAEATKLQEIFGVAFQDAAHNARPLVEVLGEVYQATANLPSADRAKKFSDAFGLLGITGARAIGRMRADTRQLTNDLQNVAGTATKQAMFMEAGIGGAGRRLMESLKAMGHAFGEAIAPAVSWAAGAFGMLARSIQALLKQFPIVSQLAAGAVASIFGVGVAAIAAGFAMRTAGTGVAVLAKLLAALATPAGLATAAVVGGVAGMIAIARQLSPAFRAETDAIMTALANLDFRTAWEIMNANLAIALTQMAQQFANAWAAVQNAAAAASAYIGDTLAEGVDRLLTLFGADILTLQGQLEKLGIYFRAAFDFSWATGKLDAALKAVDDRIAKERAAAPSADARAAGRRAKRQESANGRQAENDRRNAGFEQTVDQLRDDLGRLHDRLKPKPEPAPEARPKVTGRPTMTSATPAAAAAAGGGGATAGTIATFSADLGSRIGVGPSLTAAEKTASATGRTADATEEMAGNMSRLASDIESALNNGVGNEQGVGNQSGVANEWGAGNMHGAVGLSEVEQIVADAEQRMRGEVAIPAPQPDLVNRVGAAAVPLPAASGGVDRELLSVAERQANLQGEAVRILGQILRAAQGGGLSFA
ncbi:MAG: phage tail tape measure protein [Caulobacteraceae bacterium]|nr:phage tail tape measure protein [Caulobacteraceae bacterium]